MDLLTLAEKSPATGVSDSNAAPALGYRRLRSSDHNQVWTDGVLETRDRTDIEGCSVSLVGEIKLVVSKNQPAKSWSSRIS